MFDTLSDRLQTALGGLSRKGRLDEIFFIDLPVAHERREIACIHLRKRKRDVARFSPDEIAELTDGFSGAEIEQAIVEALYEAFHQDRDVGQADIVAAVKATVPLSVTMAEEIERSRAWATTRARPASSRTEPPPVAPQQKPRRAEARRT